MEDMNGCGHGVTGVAFWYAWMVGWIGVRLQKLVVPSVRENVCDVFGVVVEFRCANFSASLRRLFVLTAAWMTHSEDRTCSCYHLPSLKLLQMIDDSVT